MRPAHVNRHLAASIQEDRWREQGRPSSTRHRTSRDAQPEGVSLAARVRAAVEHVLGRDHSLTDYPCRLPDGRIGRVAVIEAEGGWVLVCRVA
jgi:hypothetical protein